MSGILVPEPFQFGFFQHKFCKTTFQTNQEFGKRPDARLAQIFLAGEVDIDFRWKIALLRAMTYFAQHLNPPASVSGPSGLT